MSRSFRGTNDTGTNKALQVVELPWDSVMGRRASKFAFVADWTTAKAIGSLDILHGFKVGLLCSVRCPGDAILKSYDAMRVIRDAGVAVVGGFHSPMEKECFDVLMKGTQPIVVCPARTLVNMRLPKEWKKAVVRHRMLLASPFDEATRRASTDSARKRNAFVVQLADCLLVPHAEPGGSVDTLCREMAHASKPLYTFDIASSANLREYGASIFEEATVEAWVRGQNAD